jgi:hypothetical protein
MIGEGRIVEGNGRGLIVTYHLEFFFWDRKTTKNLKEDSRSPGRHLNPGPPEYEGV